MKIFLKNIKYIVYLCNVASSPWPKKQKCKSKDLKLFPIRVVCGGFHSAPMLFAEDIWEMGVEVLVFFLKGFPTFPFFTENQKLNHL